MRTNDLTVAAGHSVARWQELFDELMGLVAARFGRVEPRRRARAFVQGLLSALPRKNCWTIAELAGDNTPDGMQHLLARAVWDHDGGRDDVRSVWLSIWAPAGCWWPTRPATSRRAAARQGSSASGTGTAGKVDNAQVSVWLAYATGHGHALDISTAPAPTITSDKPPGSHEHHELRLEY